MPIIFDTHCLKVFVEAYLHNISRYAVDVPDVYIFEAVHRRELGKIFFNKSGPNKALEINFEF